VIQNVERLAKLLAAALLALFVTLIAAFFALAGVISVAAAQVVLIIAFLVGAVFIWVEVFPDERRKRVKIISIVVLAIVLGGLDWWTLKQKRAHLYIFRAEFHLNTTSPPPYENFANIMFRNESELGVHFKEYLSAESGDRFPDPEKQREEENKRFEHLLQTIPSRQAVDLELEAHGETYMSSPILIPYSQIKTMPQAVYFIGRIIYTDENGTHHTDFCKYIHNKPEPIFSCKEHNEAP
jgi:hypothetical protein